jgi:hypothetical protein
MMLKIIEKILRGSPAENGSGDNSSVWLGSCPHIYWCRQQGWLLPFSRRMPYSASRRLCRPATGIFLASTPLIGRHYTMSAFPAISALIRLPLYVVLRKDSNTLNRRAQWFFSIFRVRAFRGVFLFLPPESKAISYFLNRPGMSGLGGNTYSTKGISSDIGAGVVDVLMPLETETRGHKRP